MDPNTPDEPAAVDVKDLLDGPMSPEELQTFLEQYAPKLEHEPEVWPRVLIMDNGDLNHEALLRVRDLAMAHKVDVVMSTLPIFDEVAELHKPEKERILLVGGGAVPSITKILEKLVKEMAIETAALPPPSLEVLVEAMPAESIVAVKAPPKGRQPSYKQFQNNRHNQGPSNRRQFAQIRPPRRGGR